MGWAWKGKCWPDTATALNAFKSDLPQIDPTGTIKHNPASPPSIDTGGQIAWSILHRPLSGTTEQVRTGTTQLMPCTEYSDNKFELLAVQDVIASIGIGLAFVLGIVAGNMK